MTEEHVLAALAEIARDRLGWSGEIRPDLRLVEDLDLDSIRLLTLAMEVEDRFRIRLDEDDETRLVRIGDLVELIRRKGEAESRP